MAASGTPRMGADDYLARVVSEPEETSFLRSIPWLIDAGQQPADFVIKGLRNEVARFQELPEQMTFSLLTPMWNTPPRLLRELILSVRSQSYQNWELILVDDGSPRRDHLPDARKWAARDKRIKLYECAENRGISGARNFAIERSTGDFLAILDHDDLIHPSALGVFARHLNANPGANFIFSNEAKIDESSTHVTDFFTKPPFDLFTLVRTNYICHFAAFRRDLMLAALRDGRVFRTEYDGCEDHDLFLRIAMTGRVRPIHVPLFLYYWRTTATSTAAGLECKPEIPRRRVEMLKELIPQIYPGVRWTATQPDHQTNSSWTSLKFTAIEGRERPSLLIVVPYKDNTPETIGCLDSLERQDHSLDVRVVLVDNNSVEPATRPTIDGWIAQPRRNRYKVIEHLGAFNFARINNGAIAHAGEGRDLVLFLNNDVELISPDALQTMAMQLLSDPKCGFVGLKLYFPGEAREVQHGGVKICEHLVGSGYNVISHCIDRSEFANDEKISFGVTFACAMTRMETFEALGRLEELLFPNAFGDVDLCARALEAGYRNYYFGSLSGLHHESKSRGRVAEDVEFAALHERHGATFAAWRLRNLRLTRHHAWPMRIQPWEYPPPPPSPEAIAHAAYLNALAALQAPPVPEPEPAPLPLRYRVADRVNLVLKTGFGPLHGLLRRGTLASWRAAKHLRGRRDRGTNGSMYRPNFGRRSRSHEGR